MGIQFFDDVQSSTNDNEFYGDWIKKDTKNKLKSKGVFEVTEIIKAKSGKGYMVVTTDFNVWLWNKSKIAQQLVEALEVYCKKGGYKLVVVPVSDKPDGYRVGVDKDISVLWYTDGKKYSISPIPEELETMEDGNPYL